MSSKASLSPCIRAVCLFLLGMLAYNLFARSLRAGPSATAGCSIGCAECPKALTPLPSPLKPPE